MSAQSGPNTATAPRRATRAGWLLTLAVGVLAGIGGNALARRYLDGPTAHPKGVEETASDPTAALQARGEALAKRLAEPDLWAARAREKDLAAALAEAKALRRPEPLAALIAHIDYSDPARLPDLAAPGGLDASYPVVAVVAAIGRPAVAPLLRALAALREPAANPNRAAAARIRRKLLLMALVRCHGEDELAWRLTALRLEEAIRLEAKDEGVTRLEAARAELRALSEMKGLKSGGEGVR